MKVSAHVLEPRELEGKTLKNTSFAFVKPTAWLWQFSRKNPLVSRLRWWKIQRRGTWKSTACTVYVG